MKFEIVERFGKYFFRIVARNGKILCHSGYYTTKRSAQRAIEIIRDESYDAVVKNIKI